jgi:DNA-binding HxlR family transcriptional regulator
MTGYGQFCPVAKAAEVVGERWTPLVLRELLSGSRRFNDLRRGVPLMSPALLSKRLKTLEQAGIVERRQEGRSTEYHLTEAGKELEPLIDLLGTWGQRWARSKFGPEDLDPTVLMWDLQRNARPEAFPAERAVVKFEYTDVPRSKRHWWVISEAGEADLCMTDPGFEVDLYVTTDIRTMSMIWMGDRTLGEATESGEVEIIGPSAIRRSLRQWLGLSPLAGVKPKRR